MFSLALVSFIAGILTILAPCVLPVLPLILAGSIGEDNKWYPYIVTLSLAVSIVLFTILLKASTVLLWIPPTVWTYVSGGIVLFLGLTYLFPHTWARITSSAGSSKFQENLQRTGNVESGLLRAILTGAALGPVFSSCSPTYSLLLATVFPVSFIQGIGYTAVYAVGLSLMLLLIARGGQKLIKKIRPLADESGIFRRSLGAILVVVAIVIMTGFDKTLETKLIASFNINNIEQGILEKILPPTIDQNNAPAWDKNTNTSISETSMTKTDIPKLALDGKTKAPWVELPTWINSKPLTLESLKGKVVIVDFWTYSCINCQRTLPYMVALDKKYRDKGLVIIGAHAPEFAFEHVEENVAKAVKDAGIEYPVVLDNDFALWRAYNNRYWPAKYFIDKKGNLRHFHFGEGGYEETEKVVQYLLAEDGGESMNGTLSVTPENSTVAGQSPETYLGTERRDRMVTSSEQIGSDEWSLSGSWQESPEFITAKKDSKLSFKYNAQDVYLVLAGTWTVKVMVDGQAVNTLGISWKDSASGGVNVTKDTLYHLVHEKSFAKDRLLELEFSPGVQAFAFTFWG